MVNYIVTFTRYLFCCYFDNNYKFFIYFVVILMNNYKFFIYFVVILMSNYKFFIYFYFISAMVKYVINRI